MNWYQGETDNFQCRTAKCGMEFLMNWRNAMVEAMISFPCVLLTNFHVNAGWQKLFVSCIMWIKICCSGHYIVKLACPYESISVCPYESVCIRTKDRQMMEWLGGYRKAAQLRQVGSVTRSVYTTPLKVTLRLVFLGVQRYRHEF